MGAIRAIAKAINTLLAPLGVRLVRYDEAGRPWDQEFAAWIAKAEREGADPNDIGDSEWAADPLNLTLGRHYLPHVTPDSVVLELGPGTGRLTRHLINRCHEMILVDYSRLVCRWLPEYLRHKGRFRVIHIDEPHLRGVADSSVDTVVSNGVFEHLDMDDMYHFLCEFRRVLKPGGYCSFNFNDGTADESVQLFRSFRSGLGSKCIFKFHHPETVRRLAEETGFSVLGVHTGKSRFAQADLCRR